MVIFWMIVSGVVLVWGLIMVISPERFWSLAKVDWNADVIDPRDHRMRKFVRLAGGIAVLMSGSMLWGLIRAAIQQ